MKENTLELLKEFIGKEPKLSATTMEAYERDIKQFLSFLVEGKGQFPDIAEVTKEDILDYLAQLEDTSLAPRSIYRKTSALKSLFHYLRTRKKITENPARDIPNPQTDRKPPDVLSTEEIKAILDAAVRGKKYANSRKALAFVLRDRAMLEVLYSAGLRISEIIGLKLSDIEFGERFLHVTGLGGRERLLPLGKPAFISLKGYISEEGRKKLLIHGRDSQNAVFLNCRGQPLSRMGAWKIIHAYIVAAGIKRHVTPHTFRNSFAAHLLEAGAELSVIREMLGHSQYHITWMLRRQLRKTHKRFHPRP